MICLIVEQRATIRELLCNQNFNGSIHAERPSRALTMERLADSRSSEAPPRSGQTSRYKRVYRYLCGETSYKPTSVPE
jgi:hypothetical protein